MMTYRNMRYAILGFIFGVTITYTYFEIKWLNSQPHIVNIESNDTIWDSVHAVSHVTLTIYQPTRAQCNEDYLHTSDGSLIDLTDLKEGNIQWCAVSRDLLHLFPKDRPKRILIEGYGLFDVRDVMNKRWEHRVDILIHPDDKTRILDKNVEIKILK